MFSVLAILTDMLIDQVFRQKVDFYTFSPPAVKVPDRLLNDLQNKCDKKEELIEDLYDEIAEQSLEIDHYKDQIRRLQESLQNSRDEIDNLTSRFLLTLNSDFQTFKTIISIT